MFRRALGALLAAVLCATPAFAQEQRGVLTGVVRDNTGAVLPGATVEAVSPTLAGAQSTVSDDSGAFRFPSLPPGQYTVTANLQGFSAASVPSVNLSVGQTLRVDLTLQVGGLAETVQVSADQIRLDSTSSATTTTVTEKVIEQLPRGRGFHTLLQLAPGVRAESKSGSAGVGGYQFDGASGSENRYVVDGVEVSSIRNSSLNAQDSIPPEFLQEIQINSGGFEARYGGALGGVINVVSKSGSNIYSGETFYQYTGSNLNEGPRGTFRRNPSNQAVEEFFQPVEDDISTHTPGFTVGGPILRDKLRFFGGYIMQREETNRSIDFRTVGPRNSSSEILRHRGIGRLDYTPVSSLQLNGSYFWNPVKTTGLLTSNDPAVAPPTTNLAIQGGYVPANLINVGANFVPSSKLLVSARYGRKYINNKGNTYGKDQVALLLYSQSALQPGLPPIPSQFQQPVGYQNVSNTFTVQRDIEERQNVYLDATYYQPLFGQEHSFRFGYALNNVTNDVLSDYPDGRFDISWNTNYQRGPINTRGAYGYYIWQDGVRLNSKVSGRNQGFYVQDNWRVHPRVTVTAGVRVEDEFLPPYRAEQNGVAVANPISFGWGDKIAPRVGAAWDVLGDGRWKIASSWTRVNDTLKYELARGAFGGDYWHSVAYRLDSADLGRLGKANPAALGSLIVDVDNRTVPINEQGQLDGIDPAIKPMAVDGFDVSTDYLVRPNMIFTVRYTHKNLVRAIEDIGVLDAELNEVYTIGNPGFGLTTDSLRSPTGASLVPKAQRDYDGLELRLSGQAPRFYYNASYTYSRLFGNWAGLANSDENGRSDPNVSRAFDLTPGQLDAQGNNVYGRLATDRPHTLKLFGNYTVDWLGSTSIGVQQLAYSGIPISSEVSFLVPVFVNGRGDLGRTDRFTQTDVLLSHAFRAGGRQRLVLEAYVFNLFNEDAVTNITGNLTRTGNLSGFAVDLVGGTLGNVPDLINPTTSTVAPAANPIYGRPLAFQGGRDVVVGLRYQF